MSQFSLFKKLLNSDLKAANLLIIESLRTPQQFSIFLDLKNEDDHKLVIGDAITHIVSLANLNPQQYINLFDVLFAQYAKFLEFDQPDAQFRCCLALYSFFGAFLRRSFEEKIQSACRKFGASHRKIFADFVVVPLLANNEFGAAWEFEKEGNLLKKMCARGGSDGEIEVIAALINLHVSNGDDVSAQIEFLKLRFGAKLGSEISRIQKYMDTVNLKNGSSMEDSDKKLLE
ncbi:hypothetical protein SS50377_21208 [Spironucleus salmonicida]|uniref:Uncharacterized protein n=1 Tax=Spironucleus salmonicida TaxID=348837 RepID=V6LHF8_9EUKA|nr:hypothetical protein SS50377_21208 [Spironucleus salmonicida]|eukprot:EST43982.1 Hypothetical protein SS50377_16290 [Spironucleus salmonicida]